MSAVKRSPLGTFFRVTVVGAGLLVLSILGFNCAPAFKAQEDQGSFASLGASLPQIPDDANFQEAVLNYDQVFQSMLNVTEQSTSMTADQRRTFQSLMVTLPENSEPALVTSASLLSAGTLAGEVCQGLMVRERALPSNQRRFFAGVDFGRGPSTLTPAIYQEVVQTLAGHFWGRELRVPEAQMLDAFMNEMISEMTTQQRSSSNQTFALLQGTCAAMLSSWDSLTY